MEDRHIRNESSRCDGSSDAAAPASAAPPGPAGQNQPLPPQSRCLPELAGGGARPQNHCGGTGLANSQIRFHYNSYGKPELASEQRLCFNISHSGEWIACAVHDTEVGIDVEQIKPIDLSVARRFFSAEEYELLENKPPEGRLEMFYDLWTLKESYVKLRGQGLSIPLDSFSVHKSDQGECCLRSPGDEVSRFFFKQYHVADQYCLSICAMEPAFPADMIRCEYHAFLSKLSADTHFFL